MIKLLEIYLANPTRANARKVFAFAKAKPFSVCLLSDAMSDVLTKAVKHAQEAVMIVTDRLEATFMLIGFAAIGFMIGLAL